MKTIWYRFVFWIRSLVLGKPKYYVGIDASCSRDYSAVSLLAKHKDGGVAVVWSKVDPTYLDLYQNIKGKVSQQEWEKLVLNDWDAKDDD